MKLTEKEKELIEAIRNFRNFRNSRHNYSQSFEEYVRECFELLLFVDDED